MEPEVEEASDEDYSVELLDMASLDGHRPCTGSIFFTKNGRPTWIDTERERMTGRIVFCTCMCLCSVVAYSSPLDPLPLSPLL